MADNPGHLQVPDIAGDSSTPLARATKLHEAVAGTWLGLRGVSGLGIGMVRGVPGIVVYLSQATPGLEPRLRQEAGDVPVRFEVIGEVVAAGGHARMGGLWSRVSRWLHLA